MVDQASRRFRSSSPAARMAASSTETAARTLSTGITPSAAASSTPNTSKTTRRIPKQPVATITPDSSAENEAGAAGWTSGTQPCSGISAALTPKPATRHQKVTSSRVRSVPGSRMPPGVKGRSPAR
jgi:hypothetical protein